MKNFPSYFQSLAAILLLGISNLPVFEASGQVLVVDQSNSVGGLLTTPTLVPGQGVSQVFNPTLTGVDWVRFNLSTPGSSTVRLNLFNNYFNLNFGLMASTQPVVITNHQLQTVEFRLPTTVRVAPGNFYTAQLVFLSGDSYQMQFSNSNPYSRGFGLNELNSPNFTVDAVFAEGIIQVPEPSLPLFGLGSFFAIWLNVKQNRVLQGKASVSVTQSTS